MAELTYKHLRGGLLRDICQVLDNHGIDLSTTDVLEALTNLLNGESVAPERRSSTNLIYVDLVNSFKRPETPTTRGERMATARALHRITGQPESGWLGMAEQSAMEHG